MPSFNNSVDKTNPELSYFELSYVFWEHNDSIGWGTTVPSSEHFEIPHFPKHHVLGSTTSILSLRCNLIPQAVIRQSPGSCQAIAVDVGSHQPDFMQSFFQP